MQGRLRAAAAVARVVAALQNPTNNRHAAAVTVCLHQQAHHALYAAILRNAVAPSSQAMHTPLTLMLLTLLFTLLMYGRVVVVVGAEGAGDATTTGDGSGEAASQKRSRKAVQSQQQRAMVPHIQRL